jgi:HEAT repeat protein
MFKRYIIGLFFPLILISGCSNSTDRFIKQLNSENADKRFHAATELIMEKKPGTVQKLIPLLQSKNERLVFIVVEILGKMEDSTAVKPLCEMISNSNPSIRKSAATSLGIIGSPSSLPYLVKALDDSFPVVRHNAVAALGTIHNPLAAKYIYMMFRDKADSVRAVAVNAFYQYKDNKEADVKAEDFMVPFKDDSEIVRYVTVQALGYSYPDSVLAGDLLIEALNDPAKNVRVEAIKSLNRLRYAKAVPFLNKMYDKATVDEEHQITEAIKYIKMYPKQWPDEQLNKSLPKKK